MNPGTHKLSSRAFRGFQAPIFHGGFQSLVFPIFYNISELPRSRGDFKGGIRYAHLPDRLRFS